MQAVALSCRGRTRRYFSARDFCALPRSPPVIRRSIRKRFSANIQTDPLPARRVSRSCISLTSLCDRRDGRRGMGQGGRAPQSVSRFRGLGSWPSGSTSSASAVGTEIGKLSHLSLESWLPWSHRAFFASPIRGPEPLRLSRHHVYID